MHSRETVVFSQVWCNTPAMDALFLSSRMHHVGACATTTIQTSHPTPHHTPHPGRWTCKHACTLVLEHVRYAHTVDHLASTLGKHLIFGHVLELTTTTFGISATSRPMGGPPGTHHFAHVLHAFPLVDRLKCLIQQWLQLLIGPVCGVQAVRRDRVSCNIEQPFQAALCFRCRLWCAQDISIHIISCVSITPSMTWLPGNSAPDSWSPSQQQEKLS